ncbi:hypothetical protein ACJX0J_007568, partial [Zea mays]
FKIYLHQLTPNAMVRLSLMTMGLGARISGKQNLMAAAFGTREKRRLNWMKTVGPSPSSCVDVSEILKVMTEPFPGQKKRRMMDIQARICAIWRAYSTRILRLSDFAANFCFLAEFIADASSKLSEALMGKELFCQRHSKALDF